MDLLRLEQQRQALDANLHQLRQSLKHWQTWEAEYEGLKEELLQHEGALSTSDTFAAISDSYGGDLVNASEIRDLTGLSTGTPRSVKQIVGLIQRRQEYVQRNIETVQRQFFDAEAKQEELAFATSTHGAIDDDGEEAEEQRNLPLTEIHEELDEDGNVISTRLSRPEEDTANVVDSLRKAGLSQDDLEDIRPTTETVPRVEELKPAITNATPVLSVNPTNKISPDKRATSDSAVASTTTTNNSSSDRDEPERPSIRKKSVSFTADTKEPTEQIRPESEEGRKSVSFAEKVAVMPAAPPPDMRSVSFSPKVEEIPPAVASDGVAVASPEITATSTASSRHTDQMDTETQAETTKTIPIQADPARQKELREAYKPGEKVIQLNDEDEIESVQVVLPENESAEDAATRREMLEYHLNEVGHVVAQMDLDDSVFGKYGDEEEEEDGDDAESYHTTSEYLDDGDTPYTSGLSDYDDDDDDEEDEHGRSTRRGISPEYRKQMLELQDRLIGNMGPDPKDEEIKDVDADLDPADVHRLVIRSKRASVSSNASEESSEKKPSSSLASAASSTTGSSKKRVSFAESVDIAEPSAASSGTNATVTAAPPLKAQKHQEGENVAPVSEKVAERSTATSHSVAAPSSSPVARKSKFMQSRAVPATSHETTADTSDELPSNNNLPTGSNGMDYDYDNPTGPPGRTLADTLTERVRSQKTVQAPSADNDNDNNDEIADRRQLASEYYRRRNNLIQEQGGFGPTTDEDEMLGGELMEEREDGTVRRVSRFKAARIRPM